MLVSVDWQSAGVGSRDASLKGRLAMNVRDVRIVHTNLLTAVQAGRIDDAYAWTRLLCRQLRVLTTPKDLTGTQEWQRVA